MQSNNNDDPPLLYISVGTEVSAKFKGAFCEAKISRVEKLVKCKVTFKDSGQQTTISDELIRSAAGEVLASNEFKIGSIISVIKSEQSKNSSDNLQLAVLNKIIDQSSYTVIFNDGDEKVVRRSFIRFKGERHYLNSETLDNAPLNNPEHFLQPIKNNSDIPNSPLPKFASKLSPSLTDRTSDTKRTSNNSDDESYDDSLYEDVATTPNSTTKRPTKSELKKQPKQKQVKIQAKQSVIAASDDESLRTREDNENVSYATDSQQEENSSDESSSSDDFPSEIKDRFVAQLYKFMDDRGTPMNRVPTINGVDIDLHRFFIIVRKLGGYNKVCKHRLWVDVYKRLQTVPNFPSSNSGNVSNLKSAYKRYLHPFEDFNRKLGSNMNDLFSRQLSNNLKLNDSHRSLQLFKNRYINSSGGQKRGAATSKLKQPKQLQQQSSLAANAQVTKIEPACDLNSPSAKNIKLDSEVDTASSENLNLESMAPSPVASSSSGIKGLLDMDGTQQAGEEVTLFSMMRTINDNVKKAKQKEKQKEENASEPVKKMAIQTFTNESKVSKSTRLTNIETAVVSSPSVATSTKANQKSGVAVKTEKIEADDEEESTVKSKRKANRLSVSGSDETVSHDMNSKRKKSNSITNKSISSNNETNDETDEDIHGPGMRSLANHNDSSEKISKSGNITFNDLDTDRVVDVKYAYGGKIHNYRAKIIQLNKEEQKVFVHYLGWNSRYDEWIKVNRVLRIIEEAGGNKRKHKTSKIKSSGNTSNKDNLSIQPDIQPVSSPSQLSTEPIPGLKSSPTNKPIALIKSSNKNELSLQRSLSCTSTCSSDQSKDECQSKFEVRNCDSSVYGHPSPVYTNFRSKSTDKAGLDENKDVECLSNGESLGTGVSEAKAEAVLKANSVVTDAGDVSLTALLSIKEELIDTLTASTPLDMKLSLPDEQNASFSSADQDELRRSPKKLTANSRKNSVNNSESLNSSRRSLNNSRKNSVDSVKKPTGMSSEIEVSFVEDNELLSNSNSALVTFDIGKVPSSLEKKNAEKEQIEKETWDKICSLNNSFNQKHEELPEADDSEKKANNCVEVELSFKESATYEKSTSDVESKQTVKDKHIVNKENASKSEEDLKKISTDVNLKLKQQDIKDCIACQSKEDHVILSISNNNVNQLNEIYKNSFSLNDPNLVGKQKIRYIEDQMRLCRESYAKLKNEIAAIDRKKKKLKRCSGNNNQNIGNTTSNEENSKHEITSTSKK